MIEKTLAPEIRKETAGEIVEEYKVSITRACCLMEIHKSYDYYESRKDDYEVEDAIRAKAAIAPSVSGRSSTAHETTATNGTTSACTAFTRI